MLIECLLKPQPAEPSAVPIANETYTFEDDGEGRRVALVWLQPHIDAFLSRPEMYREVADENAPAMPAEKPKPDRKDVVAKLKARGITFKVTTKTEDLAKLLAEAGPAEQ